MTKRRATMKKKQSKVKISDESSSNNSSSDSDSLLDGEQDWSVTEDRQNLDEDSVLGIGEVNDLSPYAYVLDGNRITASENVNPATRRKRHGDTVSKENQSSEMLFTKENLQQAIEASLAAVGATRRGGESENENGNFRVIPEADRLAGRKNYKSCRRMIELDLRSYDLIECIEKEGGDPDWNEKKRRKMTARAQSYINNSVSGNIRSSIASCTSAYAALKIIQTNYGENETQDAMDLYKSLSNLYFKRGYNQQRYVNQFDLLISDFTERGITLDDALQRIIFLNKIESIDDIGSTASTFYTSMCIQPKENRTMAFVRQQFLNLVFPKYEIEKLSSPYSKDLNRKRSYNDRYDKYPSHDSYKRFKPNDRQQQFNSSRSSSSQHSHSHSGTSNSQHSGPLGSQHSGPSGSQHSYKHPSSSATDGRYYRNNILVIPGKKPNYSKEQAEQIRQSSQEERRKLQCSHCGQYFHQASLCPNPGIQCFRCDNFGHTGRVCPINPDKRK